ncbi:GNAT family N-acetyltransferase [Actinocrinis puniceicyclus]|uniref:GNAT family N-acetyltransferase n=1 Tax=Actinocrinis puniceicyclus TaxID=977794 RepID=A0A8J8BCL7_9ACTN|nr:GNAT family N-acetyltransferase [Actinocrinis puniceicyclus]MBS2964313.1 GNAT family N-acetyltransferase [Actinocrinis puniceicyclus]
MRALFAQPAAACPTRGWRVTALELGPGGLATAQLCWLLACQNAADLADRPGEPPVSPAELRVLLVPPYRGRRVLFAATDEAGGVGGWAWLGVYEAFHREVAHAAIVVHPSARRCGVGSALLDALADAARTWHRSRLMLDAPRTRASENFAARHGMYVASRDLRSRLDLRGPLSRERTAAIVHSAQAVGRSGSHRRHALPPRHDGFVPLHWKSHCPDDFLPGYIRALDGLHTVPAAAMAASATGAPAPDPAAAQFSPFTPAEVRHREQAALRAGLREYTACLIDRATGCIAALSSAHTADGLRGEQNETVVVPEYRGLGLALRVKAQLIGELLKAEPSLTMLDTYNAVDNHRMLAVNRRLGFQPIATHAAWTLTL